MEYVNGTTLIIGGLIHLPYHIVTRPLTNIPLIPITINPCYCFTRFFKSYNISGELVRLNTSIMNEK